MFNVKFSWKVLEKVDDFIEKYLNSYKKRFSDTGIFSEKLIITFYIEKSDNFKSEIYSSIKYIFGESEILGYKPLKNNKRKSGIIIGNYKVFIEYSEDLEDKTRFIKKVEFHKK